MSSTGSPGPSASTANGGSSKMSGLAKRSTAANFFNKEEETEKGSEPQSATYDVVVELLNNAAVMGKSGDKIANLRKVQELIIHHSPDLLDNFLDEMLAYQSDSSTDVKKFIIGFMEEACKKDNDCLPKILPNMIMLLGDDDINVQKKVILTVSSMFKLTLTWISKAKKTTHDMSSVWSHLFELKNLLYDLLESVNDGIRTHVVKFLEGLTLVFSRKTPDSEGTKKNDIDMSLEQVSESNGIVRISQLEEEGKRAFGCLLQFQSSPHISSINLMTVMNALSTIAKQRPEYFDQVVQSFEALHVNLPPTLAKSQVSSVRKNLKTQMMSLLKHPASVDFLPQISTLLIDLGASQSEITKNMPKDTESRKRKAQELSASSASKKMKPEFDDDDDGVTPWVDRSAKKSKVEPMANKTAIDVTAEDILPRLNPQNVTDLVLLSMVMLPDTMPAQFQSTYTPIAAAGTQAQISHIARLLSTQVTMAGMGKGLGELQMQAMKAEMEQSVPEEEPTSPKQVIQTVVGTKYDEEDIGQVPKRLKISQLPLPPTVKKIKQFQLPEVTNKLSVAMMGMMKEQTVDRILQAEKAAAVGHVEHHRVKLLATLATLFGQSTKLGFKEYIFNDLRSRQDLAFAWLYQEFAFCQGFSANHSSSHKQPGLESYDACLSGLLTGLLEAEDHHGDSLFHRIMLEAPALTDSALAIMHRYCFTTKHTEAGMKTLIQLINNRPACRPKILELLLEFTSFDKSEIRNVAIKSAQSLHASGKMQAEIEKYANMQLKKLLLPKPPPVPGKQEAPETWTEDMIKAHLYLHLGLLPSNHKLIHELANVYTATTADIKRTILRVLEVPVKGMGMDSPELLTLVENCPKGSETLVMRVIHILTDRAVPSPELVERIRDLYHKRVPDVRFLIPVLNGLSKSEVMEALPKLIKLNPMVVKEVFNRLMGSHVSNDSTYHSPLTPVELLVALHNIDSAKCDIKTTIKAANLCFSERNIYTQEVLAIVMQQLMEQDPLPTLLMRTVIQSLSMYPRLIGFVLNILQRLIIKKVWKQKKVWEGFIRCCQRAKPQSFQVLLQLPAAQLKDVFEVCPDLREPLLTHVQGFTENQKAHINKAVMTVLEEAEMHAEKAEAEKVEHVNIGKEREKEEVHKIQSMTDSTPQKMSTLTVVKTVENTPSASETVKEKTSSIKISFPSNKGGEKPERKRSHEREFSKERRKDDEKNKDGDRSEEDHLSRRNSKGSKREDQDEEESKAKSSSSSSSSKSKSSSASSRRYTSSSSKKK